MDEMSPLVALYITRRPAAAQRLQPPPEAVAQSPEPEGMERWVVHESARPGVEP